MDTTIPLAGHSCYGCGRMIRVRAEDGMLYQHRDTSRKEGNNRAPWCPYGGVLWNLSMRVGPIAAPHDNPVPIVGLAAEMGTELAKVNPRLVRAHLWRGISYSVQLPGGFLDSPPAGEQLHSYAWLAFVTRELYPFVGSVTQAYRVAKMLYQSRWPEGTPELPAGTLVRRRLEREAGE